MKLLIGGMLILFLATSVLMFSGTLRDRRGNSPPRFVGVLILLAAGISLYGAVLSVPHTIKVSENGSIEFVSFVGAKRVQSRDIRSIKPYGGRVGYLMIRTDHDRIRILNQFDGFHEFIARLKETNPRVEIRGC